MARFWYLKYYTLKESVILLWSLFVDTLYQKIPKKVFLIKNTYDVLQLKNAKISRAGDEVIINLDSYSYNLRLSSSDFEVFNQIVLQEELKLVIRLSQQLKNENLRIVDCGANIGLSSLTLKKNFPSSKIICIEPEPGNFLQLCKNIESNSLTDITPLQMGVWHKKTTLVPDLDFRDRSNWSFALKETEDLSSNGIQVDSLLNVVDGIGWTYIDVLKIDIEGSEFEVFRNLKTWKPLLDTVKVLSIEVHEEVGALTEIESILLQNGFHLKTSGELLIGVRN
jgi:FkbM family methyltransferase